MTQDRIRTIRLLLALATLVPIGALVWLGVRTLALDEEAARQRERERLEVTAGRVAIELERRLQRLHDQATNGTGVTLDPQGLIAAPDSRILFQPAVTPAKATRPSLAAAEAAEFQQRDLAGAASAYQRLSRYPDAVVRAAALVALGRVLRQRGDRDGARAAYDALGDLGDTSVAGQPAAMVALQARAKLYEEAGDAAALDRDAGALASGLREGRWRIDRATFDLYKELLARWNVSVELGDEWSRTVALNQLWQVWRRGELATSGRQIVDVDGGPVLMVWGGGPERPVAVAQPRTSLAALVEAAANPFDIAASLSSLNGRSIVGTPAVGAISLSPVETRLPFVLSVAARPGAKPAADRTRRLLVVSGLAMTILLMLGAAYGLYRATMREMRLARQQADFVAAVSHEFRTPLTSMRHLTELLASRAVANEERRDQYYRLLNQESHRLHRLVEGLLSFARIEAGAYAWHREPLSPSQLVESVVGEFRDQSALDAHEIVCEVETGLPPIEADREALARALWNLFENAVKYSPRGSTIRVSARSDGRLVSVSVTDQGAGIPAEERAAIFEQFVRGGDANRAGIRGVGLGLALVKRIVEAHGGTIGVESVLGQGSTFTMRLPLVGGMPRSPVPSQEQSLSPIVTGTVPVKSSSMPGRSWARRLTR